MSFVMHPLEAAAQKSHPSIGYQPWRYRSGLMLAIVAGALMGLALTLVAPGTPRDPELARLLRGMVLIKGLIGLAIAGLVWWRMGRPLSESLAVRYGTSIAVAFGAVGWLWGLNLVPLGSLVFYTGLAGIALTGRADPLFSRQPANRR
jgi:hypothetical protein